MIDATLALIKNPEIDVLGLMEFVKGPDFPTGGIVFGGNVLKLAYTTGRAVITIRSRTEIETHLVTKYQKILLNSETKRKLKLEFDQLKKEK